MSEDEATLRLVQETLDNLPLYYCLTRDISHSCYVKPAAPPSTSSRETASAPAASATSASSLWRTIDPAFTWNFHMCRALLKAGKSIQKSLIETTYAPALILSP